MDTIIGYTSDGTPVHRTKFPGDYNFGATGHREAARIHAAYANKLLRQGNVKEGNYHYKLGEWHGDIAVDIRRDH